MPATTSFVRVSLPVFAAVLIALSGVTSLVTVISIYRESGIQGIWKGDSWSAHVGDAAALVLVFAICTALSAKVFRWE
jgi:hypothetical protein